MQRSIKNGITSAISEIRSSYPDGGRFILIYAKEEQFVTSAFNALNGSNAQRVDISLDLKDFNPIERTFPP